MVPIVPKIGPHHRVPWRPTDPAEIWVHARLDQIKGTCRGGEEAALLVERYNRAKFQFDMAAAVNIVEEWVNEAVIDFIVDRLLATNMPAIVALPHPEYDSEVPQDPRAELPANAIPFAFANLIAAKLGCEVDEDISEVCRPGRSRLRLFPRFLWQPAFQGEIRRDRAYILADDVCTVGGTLAMLRSHIVAHGGTVIAATTLATTNGAHERFPIANETVRVLNARYSDALDELWIQEVGHGIGCLSEAEGRALARWWQENCQDCGAGDAALQRLRDRIAEAAAKAS